MTSASKNVMPPAVSFSKLRRFRRCVVQPRRSSGQPQAWRTTSAWSPTEALSRIRGLSRRSEETSRASAGSSREAPSTAGLGHDPQVVALVVVVRDGRPEAAPPDAWAFGGAIAGHGLGPGASDDGLAGRRERLSDDGEAGAGQLDPRGQCGLAHAHGRARKRLEMRRVAVAPDAGHPADDRQGLVERDVVRAGKWHPGEASGQTQGAGTPAIARMQLRDDRVHLREPALRDDAYRGQPEHVRERRAPGQLPDRGAPAVDASGAPGQDCIDRSLPDERKLDRDGGAHAAAATGRGFEVTG